MSKFNARYTWDNLPSNLNQNRLGTLQKYINNTEWESGEQSWSNTMSRRVPSSYYASNIIYAIKNQRGAIKVPLVWMRRAGSLWHNITGASNTLELATNESRASLDLDQ